MAGNVVIAPFKIAFRVEGTTINAYLAPTGVATPTSQASWVLIGAINRNACDADQALFQRFKELMCGVMRVVCKNAIGTEPVSFDEQPAPMSERGGHG